MKNYILTAFTIIAANLLSQIPTYQWAKQFGPNNTSSSANVYGTVTDAAQNVYITGAFMGSVKFSPTLTLTSTGAGFNDVFFAKYDATGNLIWVNKLGSANGDEHGTDIKIDANSNIYICGINSNSASNMFDFDLGPAVNTPTPWGRGFVAKYDQNANLIWAWEGASLYQSIDIDKFGNTFALGINNPSTGFGLNKLDPSGNTLPSVGGTCAGGFQQGRVKVDSTGNVFIGMGFNGGLATFNGLSSTNFTLTSFGNSIDLALIKYTNTLSVVWNKQIGGTGSEFVNRVATYGLYPFDLTIDNQQNLVCAGHFEATSNFQTTTLTAVSANGDGYFAKYNNSTGNLIFVKQLAANGGFWADPTGIKIDGFDNIFVTGLHRGQMDADPGPSNVLLNTTGGTATSLFLAKYDVNGNYIWAGSVDPGGSTRIIQPFRIYLNSTSLITCGFFYGTVDLDFDTGVSSFTATPTLNNVNGFFAKYNYCSAAPPIPGTITGINSMCTGTGNTNYSIAPVSGATSYSWTLPGTGWSGTSTTNTISVTTGTTSGNISVMANNACGSSSASVLSITVNPLPIITVNSGSICISQNFTITPSGANTYTIQGGSAVVSPTANTSYTVVGTSSAGCISASPATSNVTVNPLPTIAASTSNTMLCIGQSATVTASGASTYTFNPGGAGTSIVVSPTITSNYTITGTNTQGCNNSSVFTQSVSTCAGISQISNSVSDINIYPNPFSSKITITSKNTKQIVQIFNTFGSLIYKTEIENEKIEIDLGNESSGIYFIKAGVDIKKVIKE